MILATWKGGKQQLTGRLLALCPPHRCYVELFGGMASLLLNKPAVKAEVYNDLDDRLVSLFGVVKYHAEELRRELDGLLVARKTFEIFRDQPGLTEIQQAARFLYRQAIGYGGMGASFAPGRGRKPSAEAIWRRAQQVSARLSSVTIESLDFEVCIERYDGPETFFFADPPYWGSEPYAVPFSERDQRMLADRLHGIKGKFLMTNSNTHFIRQLYRGDRIVRLKTYSTLGNRPELHLTAMNYDPQ